MRTAWMIAMGGCLLLGGCGYAGWWGKAIHEALAIGQEAQPSFPKTREAFEAQYKYYGRALSIMGVDFFDPAVGGSSESIAALATRIGRTMWAHVAMGFLASLVGLGMLVMALRIKRHPTNKVHGSPAQLGTMTLDGLAP